MCKNIRQDLLDKQDKLKKSGKNNPVSYFDHVKKKLDRINWIDKI